MADTQDDFEALCSDLGKSYKAERAVMFGVQCMKYRGNGFMAYYEGDLVLKLSGKTREDALKLHGAQMWDPSGRGRAMKEWIQIPSEHLAKWKEMARKSI